MLVCIMLYQNHVICNLSCEFPVHKESFNIWFIVVGEMGAIKHYFLLFMR